MTQITPPNLSEPERVSSMNNKQLDALIRCGENTMKSIGDGLDFRTAKATKSFIIDVNGNLGIKDSR